MARNAARNQSPHVVRTDAFHDVMFNLRRDASATLRASLRGVQAAVRPAYPHDPDARNHPAPQDTEVMGREVYARLYEGDKVRRMEQPGGQPWERRVHSVLDDNTAFRSLCSQVAGDTDLSALALARVLEQVAGRVGDMLDDTSPDDGDGDGAGQPGQPGGQPGQGSQPGSGQGVHGFSGITPEIALDAVLSVACEEAAQEAKDTREALNGLAPGLGTAPAGKQQQDPRRLVLAERLRDDKEVQAVLRKAGRLHRMHTRLRKSRSEGHTEVVDVERGGDLSRLLPSVLAMLDDADFGDATLADVLERKALQYALAGEAPLGRGPVVVCRDISGSMGGEPHAWAAAVCILAAQVARKERRQLTIINYEYGVDSAYRLTTGGRAYRWATEDEQGRSLAASKRHWQDIGDVAELMLEVATIDTAGGTRMDPALTWAMDKGDLMESRADLLVVTDGRADSVAGDVLDRVKECKEQGLRISGLTVNRGRLYPSLAQVCDSITDLDRPGDTARQAAQGVLL